MSNIAVQGGAGGTGTVTLLAPSTSTDRVLTLPDSTGTVATAESTLSQFNAGGSAPVYACRAWVNFNGTGTVAIRASGNVSSITDNGTGNYTVNFATVMPDVNYALSGFARSDGTGNYAYVLTSDSTSTKTTSAVRIITRFTSDASTGVTDLPEVGLVIFR